ncbi:hypothetical protein D0S45_02320 [Marinifilum sp. JC120]|nr:hypothetical protein D0S45_02320 [Marinifilum sp. JC120]
MNLFFTIAERGIEIPVTRESFIHYSGPSQVIATALMLRLFCTAINDLSPGRVPERSDITALTAFPGQGIKDCIEYVTRGKTLHEGGLEIDSDAMPPAPHKAAPALVGRFYFEVEIRGKRNGYWPKDGIFTDHFREMVTKWQDGKGSAEDEAAYQQFKQEIISKLLGTPEGQLFHSVKIK